MVDFHPLTCVQAKLLRAKDRHNYHYINITILGCTLNVYRLVLIGACVHVQVYLEMGVWTC